MKTVHGCHKRIQRLVLFRMKTIHGCYLPKSWVLCLFCFECSVQYMCINRSLDFTGNQLCHIYYFLFHSISLACLAQHQLWHYCDNASPTSLSIKINKLSCAVHQNVLRLKAYLLLLPNVTHSFSCSGLVKTDDTMDKYTHITIKFKRSAETRLKHVLSCKCSVN